MADIDNLNTLNASKLAMYLYHGNFSINAATQRSKWSWLIISRGKDIKRKDRGEIDLGKIGEY